MGKFIVMKPGTAVVILLLALAAFKAAFTGDVGLPVFDSAYTYPKLRESLDKQLEKKLRLAVDSCVPCKKLIKKKKLLIGLVDLENSKYPRVALINGKKMMYAASLPKIAVLLAALKSFEDGTVVESVEILGDIVKMIRHSDNQATNRVIDKVGLQKVNAVLRDSSLKLYDKKKGGGLWLGKRFSKIGRRIPDPLMNLSHAANVEQVCRFYYLLATGRLINPQRSRQALDILSQPGINHKFVNRLSRHYPMERLYRKSGTWRIWHSDSILVWGRSSKKRYILVGLVEAPGGETILREIAERVDSIFTSRLGN